MTVEPTQLDAALIANQRIAALGIPFIFEVERVSTFSGGVDSVADVRLEKVVSLMERDALNEELVVIPMPGFFVCLIERKKHEDLVVRFRLAESLRHVERVGQWLNRHRLRDGAEFDDHVVQRIDTLFRERGYPKIALVADAIQKLNVTPVSDLLDVFEAFSTADAFDQLVAHSGAGMTARGNTLSQLAAASRLVRDEDIAFELAMTMVAE